MKMTDQNNIPIFCKIPTSLMPHWILSAFINHMIHEHEMENVSTAMRDLAAAASIASLSTHELIQISHELQVLFPHGRGIKVRKHEARK